MESPTQKYSVNVRVGNWQEEICLQNEKIESILDRRHRGESLMQKTKQMYANILRPVVLSPPGDYVKYDEYMQIVCPEVRFPGYSSSGVTLSCSVSGKHSELDGLGPGCSITACPFAEPCVRNCFKISRIESDYEGEKTLMFGDTFTISPCVSSKPLFVSADVPRLYVERGLSGRPTLKLVDKPDACCRWTAAPYWDDSAQVKDIPIRFGDSVILKHTATNQNVAVETDFRYCTYFGNEYEVSIHSHKDSRGCNMTQNIWQIIADQSKKLDDGDDEIIV